MGAHLIQFGGDAWLDLVIWRSCDDFEASRAKGVNLPGIAAYAENIAEILADEQGEILDVEQVIGPHPWLSEAPVGEAGSSLSREERG